MSVSKKSNRLGKLLKNSDREMFQFSIPYQLELLRYLIHCKGAILVLHKIKSSYFTLINHSIICESIIRSYKKYNKIPSRVVLLEHTQNMLNSTEFVNLITKDDLPEAEKLITDLYGKPIEDENIISDSLKQFLAYIQMKELTNKIDFSKFEQVRDYHQQVGKIIRDTEGNDATEQPTHYMVDGVVLRQLYRKINPEVIPTPFKQLNDITNAGGYPQGSVIVLLDKAKAKKTFTLINVARGYLAMQKNVLYIDTENGANQIMGRMIQSTLNKTKKEMMSGDFDNLEKRHMRKYKRLKSEFIVRRVAAKIDDVNKIRQVIREIETEKNIKIHVLMLDYAAKLASTTRDKDDFERINNAYIDVQNLAIEEKLDCIWTAHHVTREGSKHMETKYEEHDISGSIAVSRNAEAIIGLNQTTDERLNNIQRMEVVVQRDGKPTGRALFNLNVDTQRMKEFTKEQRKLYDETQGQIVDDLINNENKSFKKNRSSDRDKANNRRGDV